MFQPVSAKHFTAERKWWIRDAFCPYFARAE